MILLTLFVKIFQLVENNSLKKSVYIRKKLFEKIKNVFKLINFPIKYYKPLQINLCDYWNKLFLILKSVSFVYFRWIFILTLFLYVS